MIRIISKRKYNEMKEEIKMLGLKLEASERNNGQKENIIKILEKNLKRAKEDVCKLRIALEDTQGFLKQEKQAKEQLKQNNKPKRKPIKKKEVQNAEQN